METSCITVQEKALHLSLAAQVEGETAEQIVERAKAFEAYLNGPPAKRATILSVVEPFTGDKEPGLLDAQAGDEIAGDCA